MTFASQCATSLDLDMKRIRVFCTIRVDAEEWIQQEVEKGTFRNRSDAIEKGLMRMREAMKEKAD